MFFPLESRSAVLLFSPTTWVYSRFRSNEAVVTYSDSDHFSERNMVDKIFPDGPLGHLSKSNVPHFLSRIIQSLSDCHGKCDQYLSIPVSQKLEHPVQKVQARHIFAH